MRMREQSGYVGHRVKAHGRTGTCEGFGRMPNLLQMVGDDGARYVVDVDIHEADIVGFDKGFKTTIYDPERWIDRHCSKQN